MDYAHCSSCSHWPRVATEKRLRYFLASCGKLYCFPCLQRHNNKCVCPGDCRIVEVNGEASPEIKGLFADPIVPMQEGLNTLKRALKMMQFQHSLQANAIQLSRRMYEALLNRTTEIETLRKENEELKRSRETLQQQNEALQKQLDEMSRNQIPANHGSLISPPSRDSGSPSDPLNLFNPPPPRPNVLVQPFYAESPSPPLFPAGNNRNHVTTGPGAGGGSVSSSALSTPRSTPRFFSDRDRLPVAGERISMQQQRDASATSTPRNFSSYRPPPATTPSPSTPMSNVSARTGNSSLSPLTPPYMGRVSTTTPLRHGIADRLRNLRCSGRNPQH